MRVCLGRTLCGTTRPHVENTEVLIVGSGAAGAVVAAELAEAGIRCVVLEEGPYLLPDDLAVMRPSDTMRRGWREAGMSFTIPLGDSPSINLMVARCIGGSSVMTGGVCFRTPDHVLHEWVTRLGLKGLTPEAMAPLFEEVERRCHVEEVPEARRSQSTVLFGKGAQKLGYSLAPNRRNTNGCEGCGRCNFGCPHKAKQSVDLTYLPRAVEANTELVSDAHVTKLVLTGDRVTGVVGLYVDPVNRRQRPFVYSARRVVLACGGLHTPGVLHRSGLGGRLSQIGRNMTLHPSMRVMARFDETVNGWKGALQSAHSDAFLDDRITLMSVFVPTGVLTATLPGFGLEHRRVALHAKNLAVFGGMIHDDPGGTVLPPSSLGGLLWGRQEPVVTYRMSQRDRRAQAKLLKILAQTFFAAGAKEVFLPVLGCLDDLPGGGISEATLSEIDFEKIPGRQIECASQHPLGSCRMGLSPDSAVVDPNGQVFGMRNLYVADASILPTSLGVNPQITVMAMATRVARHLIGNPLPAKA